MGYNPSKLNNFARGKRISGFWLITVLSPVQLIRSVSALLSSDKERCEMPSHKQLQINLDWMQNQTDSLRHFTVISRVIKIQFGILSPPWSMHLLFHLNFFMPRVTITSPRTKTNSEVRSKMKFKACLAQIYLRQNYYETSKLLFQCRLMQLFLTGIFLLTIAFEKFLRSKGNLFKKSL